jgi:hypothetical protein
MCFNKSRVGVEFVHRGHFKEMMRGLKGFQKWFLWQVNILLWFPLVILILLDFVAREREKVLSQLGALK